MTTAIEMVSYQIKPEASQETVQKAQQQINQFCMQQPGFVYRSLSRDKDNIWYDIVYWQDMQAAENAAQAFSQSSICQEMEDWINLASVSMTHMPVTSEILGAISTPV